MSLLSKIMIGIENYNEQKLTVTSTPSALTALPLSNTWNGIKGIPARWDFSAESDLAIKGTSATAVTISGMILKGHNLADDATVRLRIYDGENQTGTAVYDSTAQNIYVTRAFGEVIAGVNPIGGFYTEANNLDLVFSLAFSSVIGKSYQIDISVPSPTNDIVEIDQLALFFGWQPDHNFSYGYVSGVREDTEHEVSRAGGLHTRDAPATRVLNCEFEFLNDLNTNVLLDLLITAKKAGNLYVIADPNATGYTKFLFNSIYKRDSEAERRARYFNGNYPVVSLREN